MDSIVIDVFTERMLLKHLRKIKNCIDNDSYAHIEKILIDALRNHAISREQVDTLLSLLENSTKKEESIVNKNGEDICGAHSSRMSKNNSELDGTTNRNDFVYGIMFDEIACLRKALLSLKLCFSDNKLEEHIQQSFKLIN